MNNKCCDIDKYFIINKGAQCNVIIVSDLLNLDNIYTGVLYHDARNKTSRAIATAAPLEFGDTKKLTLSFSAEETGKLKADSWVILEFYDEDKIKFGYKEKFAKVRATAISD